MSWAIRGLDPEDALTKIKFYKEGKQHGIFYEIFSVVVDIETETYLYIWREKKLKGKRTLKIFWADSVPRTLSFIDSSA